MYTYTYIYMYMSLVDIAEGTSGTLVGGRDLATTPKSISPDFSTSQLGSIMMEWATIHNVNS